MTTNKKKINNLYASGSPRKGIPFEVRICVNCEKVSYSTPCAYCGGGVFKFVSETKPINKEWEEEFDEAFVRDDGLIDKYYFDEDVGEMTTMVYAVKRFISTLLKQQKRELKEKVGKMRWELPKEGIYKEEELDKEIIATVAHNQAIDDILKLL